MSFRHLRWLLSGGGLLVLAWGGVSIFSLPEDEVLYGASSPVTTCLSDGCLNIYTVEVGNTGRRPRGRVRVHLYSDVLDAAVLPPKASTFGKVARPLHATDDGDVRIFDLGALDPGDRVELQFVLRSADAAGAPSWKEILLAVDADTEEVRKGDPAGMTFLRWMYALFGSWG